MKFLWKHKLLSLFCVVFVIVSFFGISQDTTASFSAEKAFAQAQQQGTYTYYKSTVDNLYTATIQALDDNLKKYEGTAEYQTRQKVADNYKQALAISRSAYNTTLSAEQSKGTPAVDAQISALRDLISTNTNSPQVLQLTRQYTSSAEKGYYNQFSKLTQDAMTAAQQIKQGAITAESQEAQTLTDSATIANAGNPNTQTPEVKIDTASKCSLLGKDPLVNCISAGVEWLIKNILLGIAGWVLWLSSEMLNYIIKVGILEFSQFAQNGLYPVWIIVRKIVSLFVVFVGLWLGFMYILGREDKFQKYVPWVIIFALFINFSYPLARVAIDVSNVVALKVYVATFGPKILEDGAKARSAGDVVKEQLGLTALVTEATGNKVGSTQDLTSGLMSVTGIPGSLMVVVFVFYTAYVFFMAALMMAMRTAVLVFMIVMSPFLFVDSILPVLGDAAMKARSVFFSQLAVAPVFMIMLALSLKFMTAINEALKLSLSSGGSTPAVFMSILLMLVMIKITLKVTRDLSEKAGTSVSNVLGKVGGFATTGALAVATGGAGLAARGALAGSGVLARGTIGRAAAKVRDSAWVSQNQDSVVGRRLYDMSNSLSKSSYDLRNSSVVAGGLRKAGIDAGTGTKLGYEESAEKKRQDILSRAERIKTRYERDVVDANGNVLHRKGDVDVAGQAAFDRYIEKAGGNRFVTEEQKKKTREALAEKQRERFEKSKQTSDGHSSKEVADYKAIQSPLFDANGTIVKSIQDQKKAFVLELQRDLENAKKIDPELRGEHGQLLLKSLNEIEKLQLQDWIKDQEKDFNEIQSDTKNTDGTVTTVAQKRAEITEKLKARALKLTQEGKRESSDEVQLIASSIKSLIERSEKEDQTFAAQLEEEFDRYINVRGPTDEAKEKTRYAQLNRLPQRLREALEQRIGITKQKTSIILDQNGKPFEYASSEKDQPSSQVLKTRAGVTLSENQGETTSSVFAPQPIDYTKLQTPAVTRKNNQAPVDINLNTLEGKSVDQKTNEDISIPAYMRGYGSRTTTSSSAEDVYPEIKPGEIPPTVTAEANDVINNAKIQAKITEDTYRDALRRSRAFIRRNKKEN